MTHRTYNTPKRKCVVKTRLTEDERRAFEDISAENRPADSRKSDLMTVEKPPPNNFCSNSLERW